VRATLFDFGAGNLHSLGRALTHLGLTVRSETSARGALVATDLLVLPGVGAFGLAADRLRPDMGAVRKATLDGLPLLGVCLGMQLFFDASEEDDGRSSRGLGLLAGRVTRLHSRRTPHIGWTQPEGFAQPMYFAHAYACRPTNPEVVTAWATHDGDRFPAVLRLGRVVGVQFHPEKSSTAGLALLDTLVREVTR
jgi:imidazole glycerol-phosphate synthase subunit HisH